MVFGGSNKKKDQEYAEKIEELEQQLQDRSQQLQTEQSRVEAAEHERTVLEGAQAATLQEYVQQQSRQASALQEAEQAAASAVERGGQQNAELADRVASVGRLSDELADAQLQLESLHSSEQAQQAYAEKLTESELQAEQHQQAMKVLRTQLETQKGQSEHQQRERAAARGFLDVAIGECEFASPFAYSVSLQLKGWSDEVRSTDVSLPSTRPIFNIASMLLPTDLDVADEVLQVSVFASIADPVAPGAPPAARLLGEATLPLADLKISEGSTTSRRVVRSINFVRSTGSDAPDEASKKQLTVGRATFAMQLKVLTPSEVSGKSTAREHGAEAASSHYAPLLDRSLWTAAPLQHRICALVHRADSLPVSPEGSRTTARVALRLRRPDGRVLYESISTDIPINTSDDPTTLTSAVFGQELLLPLKFAESSTEVRVQLALEIVSSSAGARGATTSAVLDINWPHDGLPYMKPIHLYARPSDSSSKSSHARPRPSVLVSLVREPAHEDIDTLGDGRSQAVEVRIHGVPIGRPLPDPVQDAIIAICPEPTNAEGGGFNPQIPIETFYYDQPTDFKTFLESHFRSVGGNAASYFLSPAVLTSSRAPQWSQFATRFLASPVALGSVSVFLFQNGGGRADPDAPLSSSLVGFAVLDASVLRDSIAEAGSGTPLHRSFLLDLRLLEAPGLGSSLELECRVWPRGGAPQGAASHGVTSLPLPMQTTLPKNSPRSVSSPVAGSARAFDTTANSSVAGNLGIEAHEFRLNHELSVQLAKEFNLRAASLKKAGEEIVSLRRQVQLLRVENAKLKEQLEDEEQLAEHAQQRPPPEGFESLSSAELASKLQRALEKYREEKSRSVDMGRRLEEALKEASRGRGLHRSLEELETAHLQQNRELQRLQEENKKIQSYRQAAKTQEKVIAKLEKILEGSLQEVQKAQRVQVDMERLKTENLRLREKCTQLAARRRGTVAGEEDVEDMHRQLDEKNLEVARLEAIARDLRASRGTAVQAAAAPSAELVAERRQLSELEETRLEWEQRCVAAECRLSMLQKQLTESSKRYGAEITALHVEQAKGDAKISELEFLLKEKGGSVSVEAGG